MKCLNAALNAPGVFSNNMSKDGVLKSGCSAREGDWSILFEAMNN